jgi:UDP-glucose 4-epimerase
MRIFSVYGPRQTKQVVYDFICKLRRDPTCLEILGDGSQARDFTHVQDVVQAMLVASESAPGHGEVFNVATGNSVTIAHLAGAVCQVCDEAPVLDYTGSIRPGDAEKWEVDISALLEIGYVPQVSLKRGLLTVRDWYDAGSA